MSYTLYYSPDNANLAIRIALLEMALPFDDHLVDRSGAEHKQSHYLKMNPQGLLPVLVDSDQDEPLFETAAILLHLADKHFKLKPTTEQSRGKLLKWLFFLSNTLHADLRKVFYPERYMEGKEHAAQLQLALRNRLLVHFALLEQEVSRNKGPWLLGETLTVLDIYLAICIRWALLYPIGEALTSDAMDQFPHLTNMLETLQQKPSARKACQQESIPGQLVFNPQAPAGAPYKRDFTTTT